MSDIQNQDPVVQTVQILPSETLLMLKQRLNEADKMIAAFEQLEGTPLAQTALLEQTRQMRDAARTMLSIVEKNNT